MMSSIKELLDEEKDAERQLNDAEKEAESVLRSARERAAESIRRAQSDDALVKELSAKNNERIAATKARILKECRARAEETEKLCKKNLEAAVQLIVSDVLGEGYERGNA